MAKRSKKKEIFIKEQQDSEGILRKKWNHTMNPNLFIFIKLLLAILIPIVYFIYSPLLILVLILFVSTFYMAKLAERSLNKSVIRSNHIFIPKFDSALALIIIVISFFGIILSTTKQTKSSIFENMPSEKIEQFMNNDESNNKFNANQHFKQMENQMFWAKFKSSIINFGALLTGERNIFKSNKNNFNFGMMKPPEDFISDKSQLKDFDNLSEKPNFDGEKPIFNFGEGMSKGNKRFSMNNIPVEYVFSTTLSTINTILIFSVSFFGFISVIHIFFKKRKFERDMTEVIVDGKIAILSDEEMKRILFFGEEDETIEISQKEIEQKIKQINKKDEAQFVGFEIFDTPPKKTQKEEKIKILDD